MKTMRSSYDLNREDILEIIELAKKCEAGKGRELKDKILGILTFRESLRTTAALKHAILKAGGNYIDLDASYVKQGEEDLDDTVRAVADLVDILAIRTPMTVPINNVKSKIPIINCMCGDEHTLGALWFLYSTIKRVKKKPEEIKVGIYGQTRYSQPTIALYRIWSKLGVTFYEDSVAEEIGASQKIMDEIRASGGKIEKKPRDSFIHDVDMMWIAEGRPGEGADKSVLKKFMERYEPVDKKIFDKSNKNCCWFCDEPRALPDGRLAMLKELDNEPRVLNEIMMKESIYVNRGVIEWMLK